MSCKTVEFCGMSLDVEFDYTPYFRGSRGEFGEPLEPDDEENVEITKVEHKGVEVTDLLGYQEVFDKILELVWEAIREVDV